MRHLVTIVAVGSLIISCKPKTGDNGDATEQGLLPEQIEQISPTAQVQVPAIDETWGFAVVGSGRDSELVEWPSMKSIRNFEPLPADFFPPRHDLRKTD